MGLIRFLIGLLLLPLCAAATQTAWAAILRIPATTGTVFAPAALAFGGGIGLWLLIYFTLPAPARTYVLAHELTHALWGAVMGARVKRLRVSRTGGSVTLSKSNFLITLAPYFFPLYTALVIIAYGLLSLVIDVTPFHLFWMGLVGLTWGFHLTFTVTTLMRHQSDIAEYGRLFSYTVIYLLNILGVCLWMATVSSATLEAMGRDLRRHTTTHAVRLAQGARTACETVRTGWAAGRRTGGPRQ